ncbi:MAG: hypothetical protein ACPGYL_11110, partial [Rhodospirillaceae bacterium]
NALATKPRGFGSYVVYDWILRSLRDKPPYLEVRLDRPTATPVQGTPTAPGPSGSSASGSIPTPN